jgi:HK97 family phage major capsid protein/HK97 family phage prohead protease
MEHDFTAWREKFLRRHAELNPADPSPGQATVYRHATLDKTRAQEDQRTVEATLATENPVARRGYTEVLRCTPENVDLSRGDSMPLLWNHDTGDVVGVAENVRCHGGKLRARLRFSTSAQGEKVWQDVRAGILTGISVGYQIAGTEERTEDSRLIVTATRWQPLEASIVAIPADHHAGVGRSLSLRKALDFGLHAERPDELRQLDLQRELLREYDTDLWAADTGDGIPERLRSHLPDIEAAIMKGDADQARRLLRSFSEAAAENEDHVLGIRMNQDPEPGTGWSRSNHLSKSTQTMKQEFSLCRALAAQIDPGSASRAGYELEIEQEMRSRTNRTPQGMFIPESALVARALNKATEGADLVATNLQSSLFIEALRARLVTGRLGATILNDLQGDVKIPRKTADVTAYWIGGDGSDAITESTPTTDNLTMAPKTVGARTIISRKMLIQATPAAEEMVRESIMSAIRQAIDKQAMVGTGSGNTPVGILNVSGIGSKEYANAGTPDFEDVVDLEGALMADDADFGQLGYVAHSGIATTLKKTPIVSGQDTMIWTATGEGEGRLNGYRALTSNNLSSGFMLFGNWADLLIGYWSGIDFIVDPHTRAAYGDLVVTALIDLDVKVRHPESFAELKEAES